MRILHVGSVSVSCGASGPSQSVRALAHAHASIGMNVALLSNLTLPKGASVEGIEGVQLISGPESIQRIPRFFNNSWLRRIEDEFGRPDIVNIHSTYIPFNIAIGGLCHKAGWPYVITPRGGMTPIAQNIKSIKKRIANLFCFNSFVKNASAIHALNQNEARNIRLCFDVDNIIVAPNGVNEKLFEISKSMQPAELGDFGSNSDIVLGFVGRIDVHIKGIDIMLESIGKLKQSGKCKCKLFMVGPYHTDSDKLQMDSMIDRYGLKDIVQIVGPKYGDEKWSWFLASDLLIYTSRSEGFPMAVLEAMALGKPCLVTPTTNVADVVVKGGGWTCDPDPQSICTAIEKIQSFGTDAIKAAGQKSQQLAKDEYTWDHVAEQLKKEYSTLL